jgi:hypothetical protein
LNILTETRPGPAINISNTDVEVEFFEDAAPSNSSANWSPAAEGSQQQQSQSAASVAAPPSGQTLSTDGIASELVQCDNWYGFYSL